MARVGIESGNVTIQFFNSLLSYRLGVIPLSSGKKVLVKGNGKNDKHTAVEIQVQNAILAAVPGGDFYAGEGLFFGASVLVLQAQQQMDGRIISAAKQVAYSTTRLIKTADGVISGTHSLEQLIVAPNKVSAATSQLVQASRVKAELMSRMQHFIDFLAGKVSAILSNENLPSHLK
ncbi:hypothetical protein PCASD_18546 [Puccinia coronata f. sp. avenae]|uniref:I/LWEQ domain-containing protein n=1 Tax=Puccinia coronata f. sp. avenae TaxID=200324 RepID=A0A2N5U124_9BASI|nr:hypothetical protein PCASD_18546 [Puccinia coronata f. sp. avenae]